MASWLKEKVRTLANRNLSIFIRNPQYVLMCVVAMLPQFWFKEGYLFASGDLYPPIYQLNLDKLFFTWDTRNGLGNVGFAIVGIPFAAFFSIPYSFGIPFWLTQRTFYTLILALTVYSMYFLVESLLNNKFAATLASFFYVFNIQGLLNVLNPLYQTAHAATPLVIGLLGRGAERNCGRTKYLILLGLASLPFSFVFSNPPLLVTCFLLCASFAAFQVLVSKDKIRLLAFYLKCFLIALVMNMWWILPAVGTIFNSSSVITVKAPLSVSAWTMSRAKIINILRLDWFWVWINPRYFSFDVGIYKTPFMYLSSIVPSLAVFGALLIKPQTRRLRHSSAFFSVIALASIFLQKGINEPFAGIYYYMYENVPFFWIYRSPKFEIPLLISFSFLIGVLFDKLFEIPRKSAKGRVLASGYAVGFFLVSSLLTFPMFTGQVIPPTYTTGRPAMIKIPDYWYEASDWIQSRSKDPRILVLPPDPFYQVGYVWNYYGGDAIPALILGASVIPIPEPSPYGGGYVTNSGKINATSALYRSVRDLNRTSFVDLLKSLGIQYIVLRRDINYSVISSQGFTTSLEKLQTFLSDIPTVRLCATFGKLFIYELINPSNLFSSVPYGTITAVEKENPVTYYLKINASAPFTLIFSDSYDANWKVYSGATSWVSTIFQKPLASSSPILGYANSWNINRMSEYMITVYCELQNYGYVGAIISLVSSLGLSLKGVSYLLRRHRQHTHSRQSLV